jgi:hypothetical protein
VTANELINLARSEFLRDSINPLGWATETLWTYANDAEIQACIRAEIIKDSNTVTDGDSVPLCQLSLVSGVSEYMTSPKIIRIVSAKISTSTLPLIHTTESWLNEFYPEWKNETGEPKYLIQKRNFIIVVPQPTEAYTLNSEVVRKPLNNMASTAITITGVLNISFNAATKKITSATENFIKKGLRPGNTITVTGTASNNGDFFIKTVDRSSITVINTLVDESNKSAVISAYSIPEISEEHHVGLIDWICHLAYTKQDAETIDENKKQSHELKFQRTFGPMPSARALEDRRTPRNTRARAKEFGFS